MRISHSALLVSALLATPAEAVVRGKVTRDPNGTRGSVVQVESSTATSSLVSTLACSPASISAAISKFMTSPE